MPQGRNFAFWKSEVTDMLRDACACWLGDFRMDGLRFDSANDLPPQTVQAMTWAMRERFPGRILTAEARPVHWRHDATEVSAVFLVPSELGCGRRQGGVFHGGLPCQCTCVLTGVVLCR